VFFDPPSRAGFARPPAHAAARPWKPGVAALLAALAIPALLALTAAPAWATGEGRIVGKIAGASVKETAGAKVVLVQFKLDAQGAPQGAPIQSAAADAQGHFEFLQVPIDTHAVYKLGTRVSGRLVASEPFTFPEGKREVRLDIAVPPLVSSTEGLHFKRALVVLEPAVGAVWVTEVLHVGNPTGNVIDAVNNPLELSLSEDASDLSVMRTDLEEENHSQVGPKLMVYGRIQPGDSTIAFRYRMGAALGSLKLDKRWPHPVDEVLVVAPQGTVTLTSEQLSPRPEQKFEGVPYDAWGAPALAATHSVVLRAQGIPVRQELYLIPLAGFLLVMGGVVWWFLRRRLPRAA
jgi:hypothetical protein